MGTPYRTARRGDERGDFGKGRFYYHGQEDGRISVTNAIKNGLPVPALVGWGMKFVAEYVEDNWDELPAIRQGYIDMGEKNQSDGTAEWVKYLKGRPYAFRDRDGDIGTQVHDMAEEYAMTGALPDVSKVDEKVADTFGQFVDFLETMEPHYYAVEAVVHNRQFGYAGTLDAIIDFDTDDLSGRYVVDYKTSKGVYESAGLQVAALPHAEYMLIDGQEIPMPDVDGGLVLHLRPSGWRLVPVDVSQVAFQAFRSVLETALWVTGEGKKQAVGRPIAKGRAT